MAAKKSGGKPAASATPLTELQTLLVRILGESDALRLPLRAHQWFTAAPQNRTEGLARLAEFGIPWGSGEATAAGRLGSLRTIEAAAEAGLVVVARRRGVRWPYLRLTDAGDGEARHLSDLPGIVDGLKYLCRLHQLGRQRGWVRERVLVGTEADWQAGKFDRHDLMAVENGLLPSIACGWCEAHSDMAGWAYYAVTEAGKRRLAEPPAERSGGRAAGGH